MLSELLCTRAGSRRPAQLEQLRHADHTLRPCGSVIRTPPRGALAVVRLTGGRALVQVSSELVDERRRVEPLADRGVMGPARSFIRKTGLTVLVCGRPTRGRGARFPRVAGRATGAPKIPVLQRMQGRLVGVPTIGVLLLDAPTGRLGLVAPMPMEGPSRRSCAKDCSSTKRPTRCTTPRLPLRGRPGRASTHRPRPKCSRSDLPDALAPAVPVQAKMARHGSLRDECLAVLRAVGRWLQNSASWPTPKMRTSWRWVRQFP